MKKAIPILMCLLFALTILYPTGVIAAACMGYTFELVSVTAFSFLLNAISVCVIVLDLIFKDAHGNKVMRILPAIMTPLSMIHAVFYVMECPQIWVIASVLLTAGCCCSLTVKYGKPASLKIIAMVLSALMVLPICFFCLIAAVFGNIGQNTVVKTVESPSGAYYAQVIDSDQGALGGDTFVDVYEREGCHFILFKIAKKPQRVYAGDWGDFKNMQVYWEDDNCLVINSVAHEIE